MSKKTSPQKSKGSSEIGQSKRTWLNLFNASHRWQDKDEVLDAVYWSRQILAIFMGLLWGAIGLKGFVGIVSFIILNSIGAHCIATRTGFDFEPDDNFLSIKEGFMTTFATFLVTWIVTFTAVHF